MFIDIDKVLALQFKWNYAAIQTESEMFVRAMPVFTVHDSLKVPVMRCPLHLRLENDLNKGKFYSKAINFIMFVFSSPCYFRRVLQNFTRGILKVILGYLKDSGVMKVEL